MKLNTAFIRAFVALVAGALLIEYKESAVQITTKVVGILFFLSGLISIIIYYVNHKQKKELTQTEPSSIKPNKTVAGESLPIVGMGSCLLGCIMFFLPDEFTTVLIYVFAAFIILGAIAEIISLLRGGAGLMKHYPYWILPCLLLLFGITAIVYPSTIASMPFVFIGIGMIVYGISEIINSLKIRNIRKAIERELEAQATTIEEAVIVEEQ